ncbi:dienelactone hydrolase family protein [Cystobacter fuscus]
MSAQTATLITFPGPTGDNTLESGQLSGVLYLPANYSTSNNLRAVVLMHGCSGYWSNRVVGATNSNGTPNLQNQVEKWGLQLASRGIVALAVDSFTRRRQSMAPDADSALWQDQCSGKQYAGRVNPYATRVWDAQAARAWLATDSRINATRIGILGWSQGAQAAMVETAEKPTNTLFRTTVLFYPGCGSDLGFGTPSASTGGRTMICVSISVPRMTSSPIANPARPRPGPPMAPRRAVGMNWCSSHTRTPSTGSMANRRHGLRPRPPARRRMGAP